MGRTDSVKERDTLPVLIRAQGGGVLPRKSPAAGEPGGERRATLSAGRVVWGPLEVDLIRGRALYRGKRLELQPLQLRILAYLLVNPGRTVTKSELHEEVLQVPLSNTRTSIVRHVSIIRACLGDAKTLITTRNGGYCFEAAGKDAP